MTKCVSILIIKLICLFFTSLSSGIVFTILKLKKIKVPPSTLRRFFPQQEGTKQAIGHFMVISFEMT